MKTLLILVLISLAVVAASLNSACKKANARAAVCQQAFEDLQQAQGKLEQARYKMFLTVAESAHLLGRMYELTGDNKYSWELFSNNVVQPTLCPK